MLHLIPPCVIFTLLNLIQPQNIVLLQKYIDDSGLPIATIATKTGIKRETIYNRFKGVGEFTASEMTALCKVLRINKSEREKIFFKM